MPASSLLFRLFVSSIFSDFVAERDALQRRVFPEMDARCRAYGARLRAGGRIAAAVVCGDGTRAAAVTDGGGLHRFVIDRW